MRVTIHGNETFEENPEFAFKRIPDGLYSVRATASSREGEQHFEPFDFQWPAELKDGTITYLSCDIPFTTIQ